MPVGYRQGAGPYLPEPARGSVAFLPAQPLATRPSASGSASDIVGRGLAVAVSGKMAAHC